MLPYLQSPAGNRTPPFRSGHADEGFRGLDNWTPAWFASGTAALAAAIRIAVELRAGQVEAARPKVIVSAYNCPDLVAAIDYAGAEAIFADVEPDGFRIDLESAREALSGHESAVALVGVDLFGYPENWVELAPLCREFRVSCIRDCAQSLQSRESIDSDRVTDCQVYSFGRGKPLFLQGGGALLVPRDRETSFREQLARLQPTFGKSAVRHSGTRRALYNLLLNPHLYALLAMGLGDRLGRTEYRELRQIELAPDAFSDVANAAICAWWDERADHTSTVVSRLERLHDRFPSELGRPRSPGTLRLNRVPAILSGSAVRNRWIAELRKRGVSATPMYARALPDIPGVSGTCAASGIENARAVAARLMTIPAHARLRPADFDAMEDAFQACLESSR